MIRPLPNDDDIDDALTRWHKLRKWKPGTRAKFKRQYRRRERQAIKRETPRADRIDLGDMWRWSAGLYDLL